MDVIIMIKLMGIMGWAGLWVRVTMWVGGGRVEGRVNEFQRAMDGCKHAVFFVRSIFVGLKFSLSMY